MNSAMSALGNYLISVTSAMPGLNKRSLNMQSHDVFLECAQSEISFDNAFMTFVISGNGFLYVLTTARTRGIILHLLLTF